nr:geraniol 8-hydroxylase-like [Tanacetum cinerariifolium]
MQKVKDELKEVVGVNNIVEESHLSNLRYLDVVVKETFQLHPPLPLLIGRCPSESCNVAGYTVPKGANVYVNVWAIHRDPQYWDNLLEFNPNRFLSVDDGTTKFDYNAYNPNFIPFGSGRRRCPGVPLDLAKVVLREQDEIFANRDPPIAGTVITYGRQDIVWSDNNSFWRNMRKVLVYEVLSSKNLEASSTFRRGRVRKIIKHVYETMGTEVDIEFREVITKIVELAGAVNVSDFFPVLSRFDLQGVGREMKRQRKILYAIFEQIIKERIAIKPDEAVEKIRRKDFLQILLELTEQNASTSLNITQIKALLT